MKSVASHAWTSVLIVDDDPIQLELLDSYFRQRGAAMVVRAVDGLDAKVQLHTDSNRFDLIVMDVNMPHLDGIELMSHLKGCGYRGHILIASGAADVMIKVTDKLASIGHPNYLGFIKKPISALKLDVMLDNPSVQCRSVVSNAG